MDSERENVGQKKKRVDFEEDWEAFETMFLANWIMKGKAVVFEEV